MTRSITRVVLLGMTVGIQQLMSAIVRLGDTFHTAVYRDRDLDAALTTVTDDCVLRNVPAGTGAQGVAALRRYLADDVLTHLPADIAFRNVTRTVDQRRVVDESIVTFTHDRELPWLLPGIAPTGRSVEVLAISVIVVTHRSRMGRTESWINTHRTLWDHAGMLTALGLSPAAVPTGG